MKSTMVTMISEKFCLFLSALLPKRSAHHCFNFEQCVFGCNVIMLIYYIETILTLFYFLMVLGIIIIIINIILLSYVTNTVNTIIIKYAFSLI